APQIRVAVDDEPATPPLPPGTPDETQPPAQPVPVGGAAPHVRTGVDWSNALPASLWAGALLAVSWIVPYSGYFLWIIAAGIIAVALYKRRAGDATVTPANGARIGAVCGLFGFVGFAGILAVGLLVLRGSTKFREMMQSAIQQAAASNPDPRAQEMIS